MSNKKRPTETVLRDLYETRGMEVAEMQQVLNAGQTTVNRWLRESGIPLRSKKKPLPHWAPSAEELRNLVHVEHVSYREIAKRYGVGPQAIERWLDQQGVTRAERNRPLTKGKPDAEELQALYVTGRMTTRQIGARFGVRHITVRRWLTQYEIPLRASGIGLVARDAQPPTADELRQMVHVDHLSYRAIADRYGVDPSAVPYWLDAHGITRPDVWTTRRKGVTIDRPTDEYLTAEYAAGASTVRLGKAHGVSASTVALWLREAGVEVRPNGWAGGRRVMCADGHLARSDYEQRVDDWLSRYGLPHEVEPALPADRRFRSDFLVAGTYIEVWGVENSKVYEERKQKKIAIYKANGLPLVQLSPWMFYRKTWTNKLAAALLKKDPQAR